LPFSLVASRQYSSRAEQAGDFCCLGLEYGYLIKKLNLDFVIISLSLHLVLQVICIDVKQLPMQPVQHVPVPRIAKHRPPLDSGSEPLLYHSMNCLLLYSRLDCSEALNQSVSAIPSAGSFPPHPMASFYLLHSFASARAHFPSAITKCLARCSSSIRLVMYYGYLLPELVAVPALLGPRPSLRVSAFVFARSHPSASISLCCICLHLDALRLAANRVGKPRL